MIALVTGANQGLGLALVRGLCQSFPDGTIYLGARDEGRGSAAVESLRAEGLAPEPVLIDVQDDRSVREAAQLVADRHGGIDVVISNAAARISPDVPDSEQVRAFVDTNNHGAHRMIEAFGPLLNDAARFLVVASSFGTLDSLSPRLWHHFDVDHMTLRDLAQVMDDYATEVEAGRAGEAGWPSWINPPSKIGQVAAVKIAAREWDRRRGILINAVCPGLVDTEASRPWFTDWTGVLTPDEAAVDVLWLATLPAGTQGPYGELVQRRKVLPFRPEHGPDAKDS
ncbi:SDR family NAD(P)-dependent oxidoreductase [Nonomuraea antri]|uniref:SDR family NAD(P)-dependent oxidoreductase n=1 Tax=Nonomuraea antri TaxID=2730852 RepID=UPI001C2C58B7|nr:SDR family NAD(P)-dependent oxidoreductase [Nonomuraea antri]